MAGMQTITEDFLALGVSDPSAISDNQLKLLKLSAEDRDNWMELALGSVISDASAELFVLLKDIPQKSNQKRIIQNYKALQAFRKAPKREVKESSQKVSDSKVVLYCDGGCSPNPGEAGSGVILYRDGKLERLYYGLYEPMGTNNTAELKALYHALLVAQKELPTSKSVEIKCDSMYAINCITTWAISWEKNGWKKKGGPIKNLALIQEIYRLYQGLKDKVILNHIKAHSGVEGNELADRMTMYTIAQKERDFIAYEKPVDVDAILAMKRG